MTERPRRMAEEAKDMDRERRHRMKCMNGHKLTMPEHEARYYAEEVGKYGCLPDGLTDVQVAQVMTMMEEMRA